ncbi:MAG: response regulator [Candidatus Woesearchaeota archaeon]
MKKILYIEDNQDTANAVKIILNHAGFETDVAFNGKEGLEKIKNKDYDLILLDVMLPDMSGWDIFAKIKNNKNSKYAFLSAIPISIERLSELKKEGVSEYIMKPFTKENLITIINKIIST